MVGKYADILQIGARNMQNFAAASRRWANAHTRCCSSAGSMSTIEGMADVGRVHPGAAIAQVILCERGIRTFETATRNTFDINAIPVLKRLTHLPCLADPSHGTGKWDLVAAVGRACIAAGADGLIVEVHPHPERRSPTARNRSSRSALQS